MKCNCILSAEHIVDFTQLVELDISNLQPSEVTNPAWVAMHICMLSNLQVCIRLYSLLFIFSSNISSSQKLDVGPVFSMEDFAWMSRDMSSLRAVGVHDNNHFSNTLLQDFAAVDLSATLEELHLYNCNNALTEPGCLATFGALRSLHIVQTPPQVSTSPKLIPTLLLMTQLVDLALVGLKSINPVKLYWKLTNLTRLVLNHTPTSDADVLIMSKKLPALRHLGLVGCYHVTLKGLLALLSSVRLNAIEWDEPLHAGPLIAADAELEIIPPSSPEMLQPLIDISPLNQHATNFFITGRGD
jgi:hypothetical protein